MKNLISFSNFANVCLRFLNVAPSGGSKSQHSISPVILWNTAKKEEKELIEYNFEEKSLRDMAKIEKKILLRSFFAFCSIFFDRELHLLQADDERYSIKANF